jgi:hypothetical protein
MLAATMSVTIYPASVNAKPYNGLFAPNDARLLQDCCRDESKQSTGDKLYSSFTDVEVTPTAAKSNGFVHGVYEAYSRHHHLRLRPEDIWFAILTQLSFYINKHAEELRDLFVSHEGKQVVTVSRVGTADTINFGEIATAMTGEMDKFIHDKEWKGWFLPNFTTTTYEDTATAAVLMMGTMKEYFQYRYRMACGIPSVTLLGEKEDWVEIRNRLGKVKQLGKEPEEFSDRLKVVLDWFVRSFEDPKDEKVVEFWTKIIADTSNGSGYSHFRGWITAFCHWNQEGDRQVSKKQDTGLTWDGMSFHRLDLKKIPPGYASVPVHVDDNGSTWKSQMTAGSIGLTLTRSNGSVDVPLTGRSVTDSTEVDKNRLDTIQPRSGWFLYKVKEA